MRILALLLIVACSGPHAPPAPPAIATADPAWIDETLACVADRVVEVANKSRNPRDVVTSTLEVWRLGTHPTRARRFVRTIVDRASATKAPRALVLVGAATAAAELGAMTEARAYADDALRKLDSLEEHDRDYAIQQASMVIAWSGDRTRALTTAKDMPMAMIAVALGSARARDRAGAAAIVAALAPPVDPAAKTLLAMTHVWLGDLAAARALLPPPTEIEDRAFMQLWIADAAVRSTHADRAAIVDAAIAELSARARRDDSAPIALTVWVELVHLRDRVGQSAAARTALHDHLLGGEPASLRRELVDLNVVRAQRAGLPAEADRLIASVPPERLAMPRVYLAMVRDDYDTAFEALAEHARARTAFLAGPLADPLDLHIDAIDVAEADTWLMFTDAPRTDALVRRFRSLVCR